MTAAIDIRPNTLGVRLYDAHNHLQDHRLASHLNEIMTAAAGERVTRMVVNGSSEKDWLAVAQLAATYPQVFPCFGYHPWFIHDRTPEWKNVLLSYLDRVPSGLGEIGLDHWIIHRDDARAGGGLSNAMAHCCRTQPPGEYSLCGGLGTIFGTDTK